MNRLRSRHSPPDEPLENGFLFCRVESWLTGRRLVSLPFSDHCEPLCKGKKICSFFCQAWRKRPGKGNGVILKYALYNRFK